MSTGSTAGRAPYLIHEYIDETVILLVSGHSDATSVELGQMAMERLLSKLHYAVSHQPLDLDCLQFLCSHELLFITSISNQITVPEERLYELLTLKNLVNRDIENNTAPIAALKCSLKQRLSSPKSFFRN